MIKFLQSVNPYNKLWKLFLVNIVISLFAMVLFTDGLSSSLANMLKYFVWSFCICFSQWVGHVYINNKLNKYLSWQHQTIKRALVSFFAIIGYAVFAYVIVQLLMTTIFLGHFPNNLISWLLNTGIIPTIFIAFGVTLLFTAIGFLNAWKRTLIESEKFKTEMLAYKYETLQNQINPHFIFNSFNVLSDLVYEDQKKAVNFIKQMSQLFRYVLDSRDKELVPISEELKFVESFAFLLQTRFEDKLTIAIDVNVEYDEMMVPMALQLLLENCVKHNEVSSQNPLSVKIIRKENYIEVSNNLQLKSIGLDSKKTGLANITQQYAFFTDKEVIVEQTESHFSVKVPILKISES
ncbi:MAG: histidine kinase [Salinivirgaceae bacterium]|nr:histidine kinase [Salinivirgaceae bacterium]